MIEVVGIAFIKDNKILLTRTRSSSNSYTLVGGKVKANETIKDASIREIKEEIGPDFDIKADDLELVLEFVEHATSDYNLLINMHIFISHKDIDTNLRTNDEIYEFYWFTLGDDESVISDSVTRHLLPYLIKYNLLKTEVTV